VVVGLVIFELHLPACQGLKPKRKVVKGLVDRIHARFRVSVAETDHHDLHQRAEISVAIVAQREGELERMFDEIERVVEGVGPEAFITRWDPQILEAMEAI
jgi:uncharacterized protein YlxP (DUF503 family)